MSKGISTVYNDTALFEMIILEIPMHTESSASIFNTAGNWYSSNKNAFIDFWSEVKIWFDANNINI